MSSYHCTAKVVSRGKGQSAVAKAAYNARDALKNERINETCDYRRAHFSNVLFSGIFAPKDAPAWVQDREQLWNRVESEEDRLNRKASVAQLAREIEFALPHELSDEQREWMVKNFVTKQCTPQGMIADVNIHAPDKHGDDRNYHAHVLLTMRRLDGNGFDAEKATEWNSTVQLAQWKEAVAIEGCKMLKRAGFEIEAERFRWGYLSQEEQYAKAVERGDFEFAELKSHEPTKHRGPHLQVIAEPDRTNETQRNIRAANDDDYSQKETLYAELAAVEQEIAREVAREEKRSAKVVDIEKARQPIEAAFDQANDNQLHPNAQAEKEYEGYLTAERDMRKWEDRLAAEAIAKETVNRSFTDDKVREPKAAQSERPLSQIQGEIRLAAALTNSPEGFVSALEDRGLILARVTSEEIAAREKYNLATAIKNGVWMAQEGGVEEFSPEAEAKAQKAYDAWLERYEAKPETERDKHREPWSFSEYVEFVQQSWAVRIDEHPGLRKIAADPDKLATLKVEAGFLPHTAKVGDLTVVDRWSYVTSLGNTLGGRAPEIQAYLPQIDTASLLSVTEAREAMADYRTHQQQEWLFEHRPKEGPVADIFAVREMSTDATSFQSALAERGFWLAQVSEKDLVDLTFECERAREQGQYRPEFVAGEFVAVNTLGHLYSLNLMTTGGAKEEVAAFLRPLDGKADIKDVSDTRNEFAFDWQQNRESRAADHLTLLNLRADNASIASAIRDTKGAVAGALERSASSFLDAGEMVIKAAEMIAEPIAAAVERVADFGGASKPTKEQVQARVDARDEQKEAAAFDFSRYLKEQDYVRQVVERETRESAARDERDREYREKRERGRDR